MFITTFPAKQKHQTKSVIDAILKNRIVHVLLASLFCLVVSCSLGSETSNQRHLTVYMPDGTTPAPGTCVAFMPQGSVNKEMADTVFTDERGHFEVPRSLLPGEWSILFTYDTNNTQFAAWQRSVFINTDYTHTATNDTLERTGSLSGVVALKPQDRHKITAVTIQLLGTTRSISADSMGNFSLSRVPAGLFTLRCSVPSSMSEYSGLDEEIYRSTGRDTVLADTLRLPYIGIPIVNNIKAVFDSLSGIVHVKWDSVPNGYEAMILRSPENAIIKPEDTTAVTKNNWYNDTIYPLGTAAGKYPITDTVPHTLEYQVIYRDGSQTCGKPMERAPIRVVSPYFYRTPMTAIFKNTETMQQCTTAAPDDSLFIETSFNNSNIAIGALQYYNKETDSLLLQTTFSTPLSHGIDTITLQCTSTHSYTLYITALSANGLPIPFSTDTISLSVTIPLMGDVSDDNEVNSIDALMVAQYVSGTRLLSKDNLKYADVNHDTYISIHDANLITCLSVGIISSLPVSWKIGDINMDNSIDSVDVRLISNHLSDNISLDRIGQILADVDGDNNLTSNDSLLIEHYYLDIINTFPYQKK